ncbi:MAG TPA: hypothetical protein VJZ25_01480, partial [Gemmatimonadaceae bacterium]|nr:hypothetical protein [Gemmatimonadaceae bacterium]
EMQGLVYGARMSDAQAYVGAVECLCLAKKRRYDVSVVSHRTRHPFLGVPIDLHNAARSWITSHLMCDGELLIPEASVFFEVTKDAKLARIEALRCDVFIDDLPEILCADRFPASTARVLFDPDSHHASSACEGLQVYRTWQEIAAHLCQ